MDFTNRSAQAPVSQATTGVARKKNNNEDGKWNRIGIVAAIAAVVILIVAAILVVSFSSSDDESKYVDSSKLQAVFLNTGQVYFGNIKALNGKYVVLTNIYYLQTTSNGSSTSNTSSSNNVSLVKLGCELHEPYDQMVINRSEVTFWENLQSSGQVAQAVQKFEQQNPNGQKCADQSSSASTTSGSATQNAGTSNSSTSTTTGNSTTTSGH